MGTEKIVDMVELELRGGQNEITDAEKQVGTELPETSAPIDSDSRPEVFSSTFEEIVCVLLLTLAPAMNAANQGALQLALPHVSEAFNVNGSALSWTITSYSLVTGSTMLIMARLADIIGRRRVLIFAFGWYAVLSLIQGFMKHAIVFDVMRGLQAFGGAAGPSSAVGILGVIYPAGKRKNRAMATFASGAPIGFVMGIVLAGICIQFISWRAILFFFAIMYGVVTVIIIFVLPSDRAAFEHSNKMTIANGGAPNRTTPPDRKEQIEMLKNLDYVGVVLSFVGLALFMFALANSGGAPHGWRTPYIIALLIVGVAIICVFVFWESRASNALMPMFIWKFPGFALCMVLVVCGWMNFSGVLMYFASLSFQHVRGYSALHTTAAFLPQCITGILVNVFAAFTMHNISGRILMITAMCGFFIAALLWALQPLNVTYWAFSFPALCVSVVGADLAYNVGNQFSLSTVPPHLKSTAAGIFNVMTQLAQSIGIAASTAIVTSQIGDDIEGQSREILHKGYRSAYYFALGVASFGLVCSFFSKVGTQGSKTDSDNARQLLDRKEEAHPTSTNAGSITNGAEGANAEEDNTGEVHEEQR
ncbi:major facilitator superfamily domain-containing protein [Lipomyces arxii]|uniref:major facilitator superfamily domain-containing protein n=1 Tax=Lipomyces arxii TaxID=56418 RepID=UPI0034CDF240